MMTIRRFSEACRVVVATSMQPLDRTVEEVSASRPEGSLDQTWKINQKTAEILSEADIQYIQTTEKKAQYQCLKHNRFYKDRTQIVKIGGCSGKAENF